MDKIYIARARFAHQLSLAAATYFPVRGRDGQSASYPGTLSEVEGDPVVKRACPPLYVQSSKLFHKTGVATERHAYKGIWLCGQAGSERPEPGATVT